MMLKNFKLSKVALILLIVIFISLLDSLIMKEPFLEYFSISLYVTMFLIFSIKVIDELGNLNIILIVINISYLVMAWFINGDTILNLISGLAGLILYIFELIIFSILEPVQEDSSQQYTKYRIYR